MIPWDRPRMLGLSTLMMVPFMLIAGTQSSNTSFRIVQQQPDSWTIEYVPAAFQSTVLDIDGVPNLQFPEGRSEDGGARKSPVAH